MNQEESATTTTTNSTTTTTLDLGDADRRPVRLQEGTRRRLVVLRVLLPLMVAIVGLTLTGSEASATQYVPGGSAYATFRCNATTHAGSLYVVVNTQNGAWQDVGYRMYVQPVGSAGFWTPIRTVTAQGNASWSATFTPPRGQYKFYMQYYWRTTAGWISRGEWISSYRQAGWFQGLWERDFTTCNL